MKATTADRAQESFLKQLRAIAQHVDRSFSLLMCGQYLACIAGALWLSPRTWAGAQSWTHVHVWSAIFLGAVITSLPVALAVLRPGEVLTRHVVAVGQILMSALLIHITGGRIETHFHVFGSLAFLAFYRDPRVLITASAVVAVDHFLRGVFWPQSVFGIAVVDYWRWLEHTGWVVFEDVFLIIFIKQSRRILRENAQRGADLEEARDTAERANRAKDDFISVLSHELRTPLTPSLMILSELAGDPALDGTVRQDIRIVRRNVELEARLIDDLLDLTRIASGKLSLNPVTVNMHTILGQVVETFREEFTAKELTVGCQFDAVQHLVNGDADRLEQVFSNLVKNSVKFTDPGGSIAVRTSNRGDVIQIEIADTGIGIAPDVLPTLFSRFQQGGSEVTRRYGGLGLGLSICRALVEKHRGRILAASEGTRRGASFIVELPTSGEHMPHSDVQSPPPAPSAPAVRSRILLVEDHRDTRETLASHLARSGYEVVTADTLQAALEKAAAAKFDLLISDVGLPDGSGRELVTALDGNLVGGRAIAISGYGMDHDVRQSLASGFAAHLTKPVDLDRLKKVITQTLDCQP